MNAISIAIPAPTLEALLGSREKAHALLLRAGFTQVVDVAPFFIKTMLLTAQAAEACGSSRVSPACPRAVDFLRKSGKPELAADIPSPAAQAILDCITKRYIDKFLSITFISPCPYKAEELKNLIFPARVELKILPLNDFLEGHELELEAHRHLDHALTLPRLSAPLIKIRGEAEARSYLESGEHNKAACIDLQMCPGGCLCGAWCPRPSLAQGKKEASDG